LFSNNSASTLCLDELYDTKGFVGNEKDGRWEKKGKNRKKMEDGKKKDETRKAL